MTSSSVCWLRRLGGAVAPVLCGVLLIAVGPAQAQSSCSNAEFRKGAGANLPDCRAYERVSPSDKNGFDIGETPATPRETGGPATADGDAIAFKAFGSLADSTWGGSGDLAYLSRRDGDGWGTTALQPQPAASGQVAGWVEGFSPAFDEWMLFAGAPLTDAPGSNQNYYLRDSQTGALELIAKSPTVRQGSAQSSDLSHLAFDSTSTLTDEAGQPDFVWKVYESVDGQMRLVSRDPDGIPFSGNSYLGSGTNDPASTAGAVSKDGEHVYFSTPAFSEDQKLYRRDGGTTTTLASPSKRTTPDPNGTRAKIFRVATDDGSRVFFTSPEQLTDDANNSDPFSIFNGDLYRYDVDADELVDITAGTPGDAAAEAIGVVALDSTGDRVYYTAYYAVVDGEPGGPQPVPGVPNLYVWTDDGSAGGTTRFIGTLDPTGPSGGVEPNAPDSDNWSWGSTKASLVDGDGSRLVFQSRANLTGYDQAGLAQVYLYDAVAESLTCLSCGPGSGPPAGPSRALSKVGGSPLGKAYPRSISEDGRRVIFSTPNALLSEDSNGRYDAYLWQDGQLFLLSTGSDSDHSFAYGMSADGADLFFRTRQQLVPDDDDRLIDLYTAHVGGGFASQQAEPASDCDGESCQGPLVTAPPSTDPPSVGNRSRGNVRPVVNCKRFARSANRLGKRARSLRRTARRLGDGRRASTLRRKATTLSKRAKQQQAKAKRCRADARVAGR